MRFVHTYRKIVTLFFVGSVAFFVGCAQEKVEKAESDERVMTEYAENISILESDNGDKSYLFVSPLVEGYSMAREPYREFRNGIKITTYQHDSLHHTSVDAVLTANYAIYYENKKLWEAKGDVTVVKSDGKTLYTQQLFWNAKSKKIYSNVDTKVVQNAGGDVLIGEGFESDDSFDEWRFRNFTGTMLVDMNNEGEEESQSDVQASGGVAHGGVPDIIDANGQHKSYGTMTREERREIMKKREDERNGRYEKMSQRDKQLTDPMSANPNAVRRSGGGKTRPDVRELVGDSSPKERRF